MVSRVFVALAALASFGSCTLSKDEVRNGLDHITDSLHEVLAGPKFVERQMTVDILMKTLSKAERLDNDSIEVLENVTTLLDQIMLTFAGDLDNEVAALNGHIADITACNEDGVDDEELLWNNTLNLSTTHTECRAEEAFLYDANSVSCSQLETYLGGVLPEDCVFPDIAASEISEWSAFFSRGSNYFSTEKSAYEPKRDACHTATTDLNNKIITCNSAQVSVESAFCSFRSARIARCDALPGCYSGKLANFEADLNTYNATAETRVGIAIAIERIKCLINNLVTEGITDLNACETPPGLDVDLIRETYGLPEFEVPDQAECTTGNGITEPKPTDAGFAAAWYSAIDQSKSPTTEHTDAVSCS